MNRPCIVIAAYNRPDSLKILLESVNNAIYPEAPVKLVISIDKSDNARVAALSAEFEWQHGEKEIIIHEKHSGLINHIFFCAGLTEKYENIILLEDDLMVSSYYYVFSEKALEYYQHDDNMVGISLYNYCVSESSLLSFIPVDDGSDVYFIQYPSSWGLCLNKKHWQAFYKEYSNKELSDTVSDPLFVRSWPNNSWKRFMVRYLIKHNKYFVYPRLSLSTNFSDKGANTPVNLSFFQTPLQMCPKEYHFVPLEVSNAIYDSYFEMTTSCLNKFVPELSVYDYIIDLQGVKDLKQCHAGYILTCRKTKSPLFTYSSSLKPLIVNVIKKIRGKELRFALLEHADKKAGQMHYGHTEYIHTYRHKMLGNKFSFLRYYYFYIIIELKMFWKKIMK